MYIDFLVDYIHRSFWLAYLLFSVTFLFSANEWIQNVGVAAAPMIMWLMKMAGHFMSQMCLWFCVCVFSSSFDSNGNDVAGIRCGCGVRVHTECFLWQAIEKRDKDSGVFKRSETQAKWIQTYSEFQKKSR